MNQFGMIQVSAAIPFHNPAGITGNTQKIIGMIQNASERGNSLIVFPELSLTGYTCSDLFLHSQILTESLQALETILKATVSFDILTIVGLPLAVQNRLFNTAAVMYQGNLLGMIPKSYIPGYREFYEPRWFTPAPPENTEIILFGKPVPFGTKLIFREKNHPDFSVGIEICEDLWIPVPPSSLLTMAGAKIICNLSASNSLVAKSEYRRNLVISQSGRCNCAYIYSSSGPGESTTDLVFDGDGFIAENGLIKSESRRFLRDDQLIETVIDLEKLSLERIRQNTFHNMSDGYQIIQFESGVKEIREYADIDPHPFVPKDPLKLEQRCEEIFNIQAAGLAKRLESIPGVRPVIGLSGGLDSTLALLVIHESFKLLGRSTRDILALTMPGFGTTKGTLNHALRLSESMEITLIRKPIHSISRLMMKTIGLPENQHDITYENIQARARTYLLMTYANQNQGIVIGTGDLSEIALGWCTYNADHISMYNVNSGVPKTLVRFLIEQVSKTHFNQKIRNILKGIVSQPISPELLPSDGKTISQITEDTIGPYELHDFFLYYFVRYGFKADKILFLAEKAFREKYTPDVIKKWLKVFITRFFTNQWKRDCVPAGIKVGSIDLSPRGSWRMPADADWKDFLKVLDP